MPAAGGTVFSASAAAIRAAASAGDAISLYNLRRLRSLPAGDPYDSHAAVFTIASISASRCSSLVQHFHAHLLAAGLISDVHVSSALLNSYSSLSVSDALRLFDEMLNRNLVTMNTMISCLSRRGRVADARRLFDSLPERDVVSYTALIAAYMAHGPAFEGLSLFRRLSHRSKPDTSLLVTLLTGCASLSCLESVCKSVHGFVLRHGSELGMQLGTTLIDSYAKVGHLGDAVKFFRGIPRRNVVHWTAMICGLASHGHGRDAVGMYDAMRRAGVRPSAVTFTAVLHACGHAGLVDKGKEVFASMVADYWIPLEMQHYGCMVDLLAKAGRLDEAYWMIRSMRMEPNLVVWTSFLAACKKYKNFEVAEPGIEKVLRMLLISGGDGGLYTLISDLYAMAGRWDDVEKVRHLIDKYKVKKSRGSSFLDGQKLAVA